MGVTLGSDDVPARGEGIGEAAGVFLEEEEAAGAEGPGEEMEIDVAREGLGLLL